MIDSSKFDEDYYENGVITGKSLYMNYHWMPEETLRMAHHIIRYLNLAPLNSVLDFGCAKGYLVKALRILDVPAFGCDISTYAISRLDPKTQHYCRLMLENRIPFSGTFDWVLTKDVLEHIPEQELDAVLTETRLKAAKAFHVIPTGGPQGYDIPDYDNDPTHVICRPADWWVQKFKLCGWEITRFDWSVMGIKENWTSRYPYGNGFFTLG